MQYYADDERGRATATRHTHTHCDRFHSNIRLNSNNVRITGYVWWVSKHTKFQLIPARVFIDFQWDPFQTASISACAIVYTHASHSRRYSKRSVEEHDSWSDSVRSMARSMLECRSIFNFNQPDFSQIYLICLPFSRIIMHEISQKSLCPPAHTLFLSLELPVLGDVLSVRTYRFGWYFSIK